MTFTLPTSYLPERQLQKIEQRAIGATLCIGGLVPSFSQKVAFGPQCYGGITTEQLLQQVATYSPKHLCCPGENHDMIRIMLAWAQLDTGMGFSLLEWAEKEVPHLECDWL
jgi:hypothetical protein